MTSCSTRRWQSRTSWTSSTTGCRSPPARWKPRFELCLTSNELLMHSVTDFFYVYFLHFPIWFWSGVKIWHRRYEKFHNGVIDSGNIYLQAMSPNSPLSNTCVIYNAVSDPKCDISPMPGENVRDLKKCSLCLRAIIAAFLRLIRRSFNDQWLG